MPVLRAIPGQVQGDASAIVSFSGPPNVALEWAVSGDGTLSRADTYTDTVGRASAQFVPTAAQGEAVVTVTYGA